jgi:hypothetical protein
MAGTLAKAVLGADACARPCSLSTGAGVRRRPAERAVDAPPPQKLLAPPPPRALTLALRPPPRSTPVRNWSLRNNWASGRVDPNPCSATPQGSTRLVHCLDGGSCSPTTSRWWQRAEREVDGRGGGEARNFWGGGASTARSTGPPVEASAGAERAWPRAGVRAEHGLSERPRHPEVLAQSTPRRSLDAQPARADRQQRRLTSVARLTGRLRD